MSQNQAPTDAGEAMRLETVALLDRLASKAAEFELPQPPESFAQYRRKLSENDYKVLVVGEAKRGKSTFVNAIIGRDILPTDVDIATSQVFHVAPADEPAYRLRFEDDSARPITADELSRYGSQVVADSEGAPQLEEMIRWIEVEGPVSFLPKGVSVLDTPGLGALYSAHAQITHRFVPLADAVIFVLDSEQPIVQDELNFIETILDVTPDIFFIQTKIDLHGREHWQQIQRRNEEILTARFGERLTDRRVWPISSTNLRKAADPTNKDAEMHLLVSRHRELAAALRAFLFRVAGWRRAGEALLVAEHHHALARQPFNARLAALTEQSKQQRAEVQRQVEEVRRAFESDWGERGRRRQRLVEEIRKVVGVARQNFRQVLSPNGEIETAQRKLIDALKTTDAVQQRGEMLAAEVTGAAVEHWNRTCHEAQVRCAELLSPFMEAADALIALEAPGSSDIIIHERPMLDPEDVMWKKIKGARTEGLAAYGAAGFAAYIAVNILSLPASPIILAITAIGLWGARKGWKDAARREVEASKQKLRTHLGQVMHEVRRHFFDVDLSKTRLSHVDEYFNTLEACLLEQIRTVAQQKSGEARAEWERLVELGKLDERERATEGERVRQQLAEWEQVGATIRQLGERLKALEQSYAVPATAGR